MNFRTKAAIKVRLMLPKFYFGVQFSDFLLDHIKPHVYFDRWSVLPFNGQARRMSTINAIARNFVPTVGIETGTFLGSSTPYLASLVKNKVYTIEIDAKTAALASERFSRNHSHLSIDLRVGDSASEIKKILSTIDPHTNRILAYLDAHWYDAIPTTKEIQALISWGGPWVAIIDDFKVNTDPNYKFDKYGETEIGPDIIPSSDLLALYIPNMPASIETGRRKGTGYVTNSLNESVLSGIPELTRIM